MRVLVLDTIHGGTAIGKAFVSAGHAVDTVDVYRNSTPDAARDAATRHYDLIVAPVHLDPDYPLLNRAGVPVITHHEAVRRLLGTDVPVPMVEITGTRGKTTTAHALAHLMPGAGVLHTSSGTCMYPDRTLLWKKSITPASVLAAARHARAMNGWLITEESLGVTGAGNLAIITSSEDYRCAGGKKTALAEKCASAERCPNVLVANGIRIKKRKGIITLDSVARCHGTECSISYGDSVYTFSHPLLGLPAYRTSLALAGAAAAMLGISPAALETFTALPGRMSEQHKDGIVIIDNANSGTNVATTIEAARYARERAGTSDLTLVIGTVAGDGAVCEGFSPDQVAQAIREVRPDRIVYVGKKTGARASPPEMGEFSNEGECTTLDEARRRAVEITSKGSIVLAVKTWR
jgi:UDP-N-acetylmuramyl pentapeptide synthase